MADLLALLRGMDEDDNLQVRLDYDSYTRTAFFSVWVNEEEIMKERQLDFCELHVDIKPPNPEETF